jgi:hypothetical protein
VQRRRGGVHLPVAIIDLLLSLFDAPFFHGCLLYCSFCPSVAHFPLGVRGTLGLRKC